MSEYFVFLHKKKILQVENVAADEAEEEEEKGSVQKTGWEKKKNKREKCCNDQNVENEEKSEIKLENELEKLF